MAYAIGYPEPERRSSCGRAWGWSARRSQSEQPLLVNDVASDPRYVEFVPGMQSELVVPLLHKSRPIGALNILSRNRDQFTRAGRRDRYAVRRARRGRAGERAPLRAQPARRRSLRNARRNRPRSRVGARLDELFTRIAQLTKRVIDYRTFGILLVNDDNELEMKHAVQYGEKVEVPRVPLGEGLVGYAALHREAVLVRTSRRTRATSSSSPTCAPSWRFRCC